MQDDQKARLEYDVRLAALSQACHDLRGHAEPDKVLERATAYADFLRNAHFREISINEVVEVLLAFDTRLIGKALAQRGLELVEKKFSECDK